MAITELIKTAWSATVKVPYLGTGIRLAPVILITVVVLILLFQWQCGSSANEEKLQDLGNEVIEQQATEAVAETRAEKVEKTERQAVKKAIEDVKKAREARNANTQNTTFDEANSARCRAYPESTECRKK